MQQEPEGLTEAVREILSNLVARGAADCDVIVFALGADWKPNAWPIEPPRSACRVVWLTGWGPDEVMMRQMANARGTSEEALVRQQLNEAADELQQLPYALCVWDHSRHGWLENLDRFVGVFAPPDPD